MKHVVIGAGGVGSHLLPLLCRYLNYAEPDQHEVLIIDGKRYEDRKRERQVFDVLGNKAQVQAALLKAEFPSVNITAQPCFVGEDNIDILIESGDTIFCAPDNHPTRRLLSEYVESLTDGLLIMGGNDYFDGDVNIFHRVAGRNSTTPPHVLYPEIGAADGVLPDQLSCEVLTVAGAPQLVFANATVAVLMCNAYWSIRELEQAWFSRLSFNLKIGSVNASKEGVIRDAT